MSMKWELLEHNVLYEKYFRLEEYCLRHERFDGGTHKITREIFERGNAVAVLPYDAKRDRLILLEQFRTGAINFSDNPWLLELVAGIIEEGETLEEVARRETQEEAGCTIKDLIPALHYLVSPGGTTETVALYVANIDSEGLGGIFGQYEEHEDIKVHVVSREQAMDMIAEGRICNATALIGLQWLALHHLELKKKWS